MAGSAPLEPLPVFFRAVEGFVLLLVVIVFVAAGSLMDRKVPRTVRKSPRVSRVHGRTV